MYKKGEVSLSLILVMVLLSVLLSPVTEPARAAIPVPHNLYGQAMDSSGVVFVNGSYVSAWIDGMVYGWNWTFYDGGNPDPMNRSGKFDIDTAGNQITIPGDPDTPWVKEGGDHDVDDIMYVWGDMTDLSVNLGSPTTIFEQTTVWRTFVYELTDLSEAQIQPPALPKINNILTQPGDPGNQYIYIYGPEGTTMEEFYLEKNDGQLHDPATRINLTGTISETYHFYVDLGATDYLDINGDELKLVWENPGGPGSPFGGMDVVVDRVEYNATVGGTHYGEPDNTIMPDATAPGFGFDIHRQPTPGSDTNDCSSDFIPGIGIGRPPRPPYPLTIGGGGQATGPGQTVDHATNRVDPFLEFAHTDLDADPQVGYQMEVATDPDFTSLIWSSYQPLSGADGEFYGGPPFMPGTCYYYRARTTDGWDYGPWANTTICMNTPPPVPDNIWPHNETVFPLGLVICWSVVIDADNDTVQYNLVVGGDPNFMPPILYSESTPANCSSPHDFPLTGTYYWVVSAYDGYEYSGWSNESAPWYFNTYGSEPPEATHLAVEGYLPGTLGIVRIVNRVDSLLNWTFMDLNAGESQQAFELEIGTSPGQGNDTIWSDSGGTAQQIPYAGPGLAECSIYFFRVRVLDDSPFALWSPWEEIMFHTNCVPTAPVPVSPFDGEVVAPYVGVSFTWLTSIDADLFDTISYTFQVALDPGFTVIILNWSSIPGPPIDGFEPAPGECYYWRINATDGWESSPWSEVMSFCADDFPAPPVGLAVESYMSGPELMHIAVPEPTLNWTFIDPDPGDIQTEFEVEVWTDPGATGTLMWGYAEATFNSDVDYNVDGTATPLIQGTSYHFRVRTKDAFVWSDWSELQFGMSARPPAPLLISPANGAQNVPVTLDISWQPVTDPNGDSILYRWYVDTQPIPTALYVDNGTTTETSVSLDVTLDFETNYYWIVCSDDGWEQPHCSEAWSFRTAPPPNDPPNPPLGLAVDGVTEPSEILHVLNHDPVLNWTFSDPDGDDQGACHLQVWEESPGTGNLVWDSNTTSPENTVTYDGASLVDGQDYWFMVKARDERGLWSDWSELMFHMNALPSIPELSSPASASTNMVPGSVRLEWNVAVDPDVDGVTYYWYLTTQPDFSTLVDSRSTANTSATVTTLPLTTYHWRVKASDGYESSENSTRFEFTVGPDSGSIGGTVVRDSNDEPLEGATVELADSDGNVVDTQATDANGGFTFADVDFGMYSLKVSKPGHEDELKENVNVAFLDPNQDLGTIRLRATPEPAFDWLPILVILVVIAIIVAALLVFLVGRKRRKEVPEDEE